MLGRRYTVLIADRSSGVLRRVTIKLRTAMMAVAGVLMLPILIGLGARWSARVEMGQLAATNGRAGLDRECAQVAVPRREAVPVFEDDQVAVVARVGRRFDDAIGGRVDGLAFFRGDIEPLMEARLAGERIASAAERAGEPAVRRPDGGRCGGERFALLDVLADIAEAALESLQEIAQHAERIFRRRQRREGRRDGV